MIDKLRQNSCHKQCPSLASITCRALTKGQLCLLGCTRMVSASWKLLMKDTAQSQATVIV